MHIYGFQAYHEFNKDKNTEKILLADYVFITNCCYIDKISNLKYFFSK